MARLLAVAFIRIGFGPEIGRDIQVRCEPTVWRDYSSALQDVRSAIRCFLPKFRRSGEPQIFE